MLFDDRKQETRGWHHGLPAATAERCPGLDAGRAGESGYCVRGRRQLELLQHRHLRWVRHTESGHQPCCRAEWLRQETAGRLRVQVQRPRDHHGLWHVRHPVGLGLPVGGLPRCAHRSGIAQKGRIDLAARLPRRPSRGCRWRRVHPAAARAVKWRWQCNTDNRVDGWSDHESLTVELDGQDYFYMSAPSNSWVCLREWG
mmetsp:Transcript_147923/g.474954  ORF Transcript_147923/g.474954 Transcript_147923/m.474954 type:complete len:200 (+) Transcript_147923:844-1443(+)